MKSPLDTLSTAAAEATERRGRGLNADPFVWEVFARLLTAAIEARDREHAGVVTTGAGDELTTAVRERLRAYVDSFESNVKLWHDHETIATADRLMADAIKALLAAPAPAPGVAEGAGACEPWCGLPRHLANKPAGRPWFANVERIRPLDRVWCTRECCDALLPAVCHRAAAPAVVPAETPPLADFHGYLVPRFEAPATPPTPAPPGPNPCGHSNREHEEGLGGQSCAVLAAAPQAQKDGTDAK